MNFIKRVTSRISRLLKDPLLFFSLSWTAEIYGLGKSLRYISEYPQWLPIDAVFCHGVNFEPRLYKHERENPARIYIGWHPQLIENNNTINSKKIIRIPHPWVRYRHLMNYQLQESRSGTIVFYPHTTGSDRLEWDPRSYLESLRGLEEKFQPITICLHHHDATPNNRKLIEEYNFQSVTLGDPFSRMFVDKFYELVCQFKFATSTDWGSQTAYCTELGLPYFYFGKTHSIVNVSDENLPKGLVKHEHQDAEELYKKARSLFSHQYDYVTEDQLKYINEMMCLRNDFDYKNLKKILIYEFFLGRLSRFFLIWQKADSK